MEPMSEASFTFPAVMLVPHLQARLGKALLCHRRDALAFLEQRCDATIALIDRFDTARSAVDLWAACSEFMIAGASDYCAAVGKLARSGWHDLVESTGACAVDELHDIAVSPQLVA